MNATRSDEVQFGRAGRAAGAWLTGTGLLAAHMGTYLLAGVSLLLINLFRSPTDLWVDRPLLVWAVVLVVHATLVGAKQITQSTTKRMTTGRPVPQLTATRRLARRARSGRTAVTPRPIQPRFRPTPITPRGEARPEIRDLTTRSQDLAVRGLALATRASRRLLLRGRDLWEQQAREALVNAGSRLKDAARHPRTSDANQTTKMPPTWDGDASSKGGPALPLVEVEDAAVKADWSGPRHISPLEVGAVDQSTAEFTAASPPATGATESPLPADTSSGDDEEASSSPWGPLPSWARIRPNGADGDAPRSSAVRGRFQASTTNHRLRPVVPEPKSSFGPSTRSTAPDEDVLLDETPAIATETEWTWMEAAAASWLARRERQDRPDQEKTVRSEPGQAPLDPERLQA